jgi:glutamate/aspartate transport system substrate-binding protein
MRFALAHRIVVVCIAACAALASGAASAQAAGEAPARALSGTLARIKTAGVVHIGYRANSVPFSFGSLGGASGYSIDLCNAIVEDIAQAVGVATLRVEYLAVTAADRFDRVADGLIDLECGTTTATAERRSRVAFSPTIFVTGTRLLVRRGAGVRSIRDLVGKNVLVVRGTTNEGVMRVLAMQRGRTFNLMVVDGYERAFEQLAASEAQALAADDVLLTGMIVDKRLQGRFDIVGGLLSYEPYAIMFARDDAPLADVVQATFARLAASRELRWIYTRWFESRLPNGVLLGVPMSAELEGAFEMLGLPPE